jgi:hypothetical protein
MISLRPQHIAKPGQKGPQLKSLITRTPSPPTPFTPTPETHNNNFSAHYVEDQDEFFLLENSTNNWDNEDNNNISNSDNEDDFEWDESIDGDDDDNNYDEDDDDECNYLRSSSCSSKIKKSRRRCYFWEQCRSYAGSGEGGETWAYCDRCYNEYRHGCLTPGCKRQCHLQAEGGKFHPYCTACRRQ